MAKTLTLRDANQQFARRIREVEGGEEFPAMASPLLVCHLSPVAAS
jgi:hypothetical protein